VHPSAPPDSYAYVRPQKGQNKFGWTPLVVVIVVVVVVVGIMTVKLLGAFLQCFDDEFAEVRAEACIAASRLRIRDDQVISKLCNRIRDDAIHRVKALAIQGLSNGGSNNCNVV